MYLDRKKGEKFSKKSFVHILVHLIENKPVSNAETNLQVGKLGCHFPLRTAPFRTQEEPLHLPAVDNIVLDMLGMLVVAEIAVHLHLHQEEPDGGGGHLDTPGDKSDDTSDNEDAVPEPQQGKHLTRDDIILCDK